jgi:hypothetical protein
LAQAASDKVLAASISSTLISMLEAYFLVVDVKAHERCVSVEATTCKSKPKASVTGFTTNWSSDPWQTTRSTSGGKSLTAATFR